MLPRHLRSLSANSLLGIQAPNDVISPLRVVMLERGRYWIKNLGLTLVKAASEYLYCLPGSDSKKPFYQRVVVISKKENILDDSNHIKHLVEMAILRPNKLSELAHQISVFIKHTHLTDNHIGNFRFLDDNSDRVVFLDGEPIGALAEASQAQMVRTFSQYDQGFFPLLGLKRLQKRIPEQLKGYDVSFSNIQLITQIFNAEIEPIKKEIICERRWENVKILTWHYFPILPLVLAIFRMLQNLVVSSFHFCFSKDLSKPQTKEIPAN